MKKNIVFIVILCIGVLIQLQSYSQEFQLPPPAVESKNQQVFYLNFPYFIFSTFQIGYEIGKYNSKNSFLIQGGVSLGYIGEGVNTEIQTRFGSNKFYLTEGRDFQNIYLAPYVNTWYIDDELSVASGVLFGYKLIKLQKIVFDVYLGGGIYVGDEHPIWHKTGIFPKGSVQLGMLL